MKLKKSIITLLILFFSIFIIGNVKCYAATGSFSIKPTSLSVKKRKTTTVTLTVKNCEGTFTVASSDTSIATVSISDNDSDGDGWITSTATIKIKAKKAGTATITVSASDVSDTSENEVTGSKTIKVTVTDSTSNNTSGSSSGDSNLSDKDTTNKLSIDATLKNLGIKPYDFTGFKKATTSYSVTVPYEAEKVSIYADASHSKATVTGTGSKKLEIGENTFKVKVTAEDKKTTKTYTLNITRKKEAEISTDATLKNLGITPTEYDFSGFRKMTTSYDIKVPYDAKEIKIYADASNSKSTVTGIGTETLDVGLNTFKIKVTAEDKKTTKIYTLNITREEEKEIIEELTEEDEPIKQENEISNDKTEEPNVIGLTNLAIEGLELTPTFSNDIYEYKVVAPVDIKVLDIKTERSSDDITIDIVGNTNLQPGENVVTLLVYNSKKDETTTYQIIANLEDKIDLTDVNNSISSVQRAQNAKKAIIIGGIIIIIMLTVVFIIKRNKLLSRNEFMENYNEPDKINLSKEGSLFERINENTEETVKKRKKSKGKRFK